jgi:metal-sulfur cluster biosynthetic enzyme
MTDTYGFEEEKDEPDMIYDRPLEQNNSANGEVVEEKVDVKEEKEFAKLSLDEIENKVDKKIVDSFKNVKDPELDMDIWNLGLIYDVNVNGQVDVTMTFTSPMCPFGPQIVESVKNELKENGFEKSEVEVVFNPLWEPSEEVKEMLGVA